MKDQNRNQKAPETKLTDEQLGEVNAGMASANSNIRLANKAVCNVEGQLNGSYNFQGKVDNAKSNLIGVP